MKILARFAYNAEVVPVAFEIGPESAVDAREGAAMTLLSARPTA